MDDKTKLYVFAKKEVALIFLFMVLIGFAAFVLGVKVGKNFSYQNAGLTSKEGQVVDMLSSQEEDVQKVLDERNEGQAKKEDNTLSSGQQRLEEIINKEFGKEEERMKAMPSNKKQPVEVKTEEKNDPSLNSENDEVIGESQKVETSTIKKEESKSSDEYTGKWTIQLGSHKTTEDAERFADGFRIRGYNPIINEVIVKGRGTWYRVSLGVFETMNEAKEYVLKEKSLFEGQDYVFGRFE